MTNFLKKTPEIIKKLLRPIRNLFVNKYDSECGFWVKKNIEDNGTFNNDFYEDMLLAMAQEKNTNFVSNKILADFGCGPRGTLVWASQAKLRIGIDALVDQYSDNFKEEIIKHNLLDKMEIVSYRVSNKGPRDDEYRPFYDNNLKYIKGSEGILWFKAKKL